VQRDFFTSRMESESVASERIERDVRFLVGFGLVLTIAYALALSDIHCLHWLTEVAERSHAWMIVGIAVPAAAAALYHGYSEKLALASHVKRYNRIRSVFNNAADRLKQHLAAGDDEAARRVLRDLGCQALEENGDWVMLHRDRPLEVPQPG